MKKKLSILIMALSLVVISGCKHGLTVEDIARAQGICWWDVDLSSVENEDPNFGIAYRDEAGTIIPTETMFMFHSSDLGWPRPDNVRVIIWDFLEPEIKLAILWDNGGGVRSSVTNKFAIYSSTVYAGSSKSTVKLGEPLLSGETNPENEPAKKLHLIMQAGLDRIIKSEPAH